MVDNQDVWTVHLSGPRRCQNGFRLEYPGRENQASLRLGCRGTSVRCAKIVSGRGVLGRGSRGPEVGGVTRTSVRCVPRWHQAGESPAGPRGPEVGGVPRISVRCVPRWRQAGVSPAGPRWPEVGGVPRTSVRCVPSWRQAGVSPAEGQVGQRLGSLQDKCPVRAKMVSG